MKNQGKQEVRSFGIISLFLLVAACVLVFAPAWNGGLAALQERTLHRAESLGYQLLDSRKPSTRTPAAASEVALNHLALDQGQIGLDPWGHPYQFKLLKLKEFQKTKIVVWSLGPNGVSETTQDSLDPNRDTESLDFEGDDLGVIVSVK